jgi:hypothetical protein
MKTGRCGVRLSSSSSCRRGTTAPSPPNPRRCCPPSTSVTTGALPPATAHVRSQRPDAARRRFRDGEPGVQSHHGRQAGEGRLRRAGGEAGSEAPRVIEGGQEEEGKGEGGGRRGRRGWWWWQPDDCIVASIFPTTTMRTTAAAAVHAVLNDAARSREKGKDAACGADNAEDEKEDRR